MNMLIISVACAIVIGGSAFFMVLIYYAVKEIVDNDNSQLDSETQEQAGPDRAYPALVAKRTELRHGQVEQADNKGIAS